MSPRKPIMRIVSGADDEIPADDESGMPRHRALLVREAQRGNVAAFEKLAKEHYQKLYSFAMGFADDAAEAADIAQEALVKAYRNIGSYRFAASFGSWLLQIARNSYRDRYRQKQQLRAKHQRFADLSARRLPTSPEQALMAKESREAIQRAMQRMDPKFREVVILFDLEGLHYQEIADVCGIPMGTVKSRLRRGRDALCKLLMQEGVIGQAAGSAFQETES
jgi:RNA polymerase sigma-70 factor (ECF subfamily)